MNIIMAVVGFAAYLIAYNIVGWFYRTDMIDGRGAGHILHWVIRLIVFLAIYYAVATIIRIYKWVIGIPMYVWWIVAVVVGVAVILIIATRCFFNRRKLKNRNGGI